MTEVYIVTISERECLGHNGDDFSEDTVAFESYDDACNYLQEMYDKQCEEHQVEGEFDEDEYCIEDKEEDIVIRGRIDEVPVL